MRDSPHAWCRSDRVAARAPTRSRLVPFIRRVAQHDILRLALLVAVAAFALDWASKSWAVRALQDSTVSLGTLFVLTLERNEGLAFSAGSGAIPSDLVLCLRIITLAGLLYLARNAIVRSRRYATGFALLVAGGLGNAADLAFRNGAVVDFIGAGPYTFRWAGEMLYFGFVFNVADVAILGGLVLVAPQIRRWALTARTRLAVVGGRGISDGSARA